jgi:YVTN family beta-propeller protein
MRHSTGRHCCASVIGLLLLSMVCVSAQQTPYLHAPSVTTYAKHDPSGVTILPTGRMLKPVGRHLPLARWPHGLTLSPDGATAFVASEGVGQLISEWQGASPVVTPIMLTESEGQTPAKKRRENGGAAAFSPDGKTLYWSSGESGEVYLIDVPSHQMVGSIALNGTHGGRAFIDSFVMDVKLSEDGKHLYCADVTNFRVVVVDVAQKRVVGSVDVGRYPYALAVHSTKHGSTVYVANIGMFTYAPIPPPDPNASTQYDKRGLTFPPFGFPSQEARDGVDVEGRHVPGLGDPNVPDSFSVWGIDVREPAHPVVVSRIKTGLLVGAASDNGKTVGGSAPNFLVVGRDALYVSNGNNDSIEHIRLATDKPSDKPADKMPDKITSRIPIRPSPLVAKLRGAGPSGMALSPDGSRLYVAESGLNALAVIDTRRSKVIGHIPTAWYPYRVALAPDGKHLLCICFRGFGNGPSGGKSLPNSPYLHMKGVLSVLDVPTDAQLAGMTQDTLSYNGIVDKSADRAELSTPLIPALPGKASEQIKYVVFITKENHTYDTIFDHIAGANDDPALLRWGLHQKITEPGQPTLDGAAVMTNHNALARQFTVSDNFYMEPEASGVGHRWLIGVQPNNWCQMLYTLGWNFKADSSAPGRRVAFGSNGSIAPEDYPEAGSMWEHLARHGVPFRNYGEGFEFAGVGEDENERRTGAREVVNIPMSKVVYDNTCRDFPIFNMNIPDQYRAYWFEQDFTRLFLNSKAKMPSFVNIAICNDHGTEPNAAKGYPYRASWMADNDLALGRIVDFLSHTPYWKNMAIFVTQDDSGGEPDHVDAQRSVLLCISPWARHGYVSHRQTTIVSMHRTLYEIFGLPPLNMFDALANDFSDCFTTTPDFRPYSHVGVDPRIFDPEKAKDPKDPDYQKARLTASVSRDDPDEEEAKEEKLRKKE